MADEAGCTGRGFHGGSCTDAGGVLTIRAISEAFALGYVPERAGRGNISTRGDSIAAAGIGGRPVALVEVGGIGRVGPGVAVDAYFAVAVEVVEDDILACKSMLVGRDLLAEDGDLGIAVRFFQVAELLIVGAIFFDDVDDVLDWSGHADALWNDGGRERRPGLGKHGVCVGRVLNDHVGPAGQVGLQCCYVEDLEAALLHRFDGLIAAPIGSERTGGAFTVGMPGFALAVTDIELGAAARERERRWIPAGGDEADDGAMGAVSDADYGDGVVVGVGDIAQLAHIVDFESVGSGAFRS